MRIKVAIFLLLSLFFSPPIISAREPNEESVSRQAHAMIINQVRGTDCCEIGSTVYFSDQVQTFKELNLPVTFTLRYDTLFDSSFIETFKTSPDTIEYGAFLEIIPSLAKDADVEYFATADTWYEAQYAFLIGYSQQDRKKIIDTYMDQYFKVFNEYPKVTTAWMIDPWSLSYLKQEYGVLVHQITREQYGTDSYALYGGPPHYPYWPTDNWALVPSDSTPSQTMPLIIRQTITDPVENYGDDMSFHTSQPNDYLQDPAQNIQYFLHLFEQAHQQPQASTFALLGLENSMAEIFQQEFKQQLKLVSNWQNESISNQVVSPTNFEKWFRNQTQVSIRIYAGETIVQNKQSKAWWITTPYYRARVRLDQHKLYITDLRVYSDSFEDPYLENKAENLGWWIVPFSLDGSRFFYNQIDPEPNQLALDNLTGRKEKDGLPTHILVSDDVSNVNVEINETSSQVSFSVQENTLSLVFTPVNFSITNQAEYKTEHPWLSSVIQDLSWFSELGTNLWGFEKSENEEMTQFTSFVSKDSLLLNEERKTRYPLLFPELTTRQLDSKKTYLYTNNQYAIVGRNPVRLVLFPRDEYDSPTLLKSDPKVETDQEINSITLKRQHGNSGMLFMDFENKSPLSTHVEVISGDFSVTQTIYFAPNCKQEIKYCLTHPRHTIWYVRAVLDDRKRALDV